MKKVKLPVIIGVSAAAVAVIAAVCVMLFMNRSEAYRIIKVYEFEGEGTVTREDIGEITPYSNMVLEAGDNIYFKQGTMTLRLDEDKYVYVEDETEFAVYASGSPENSKTKIELKRGAIVNELQNKLSNDSSYEVNTPNSTMSVRGTTFRVEVYYDEDGVCYTKVTVFEGKVETWLVYADGSQAGTSVSVEEGKEVIIYKDDVTTDYLTEVRDIRYGEFTERTMKLLHKLETAGTVSLEAAGSVSGTDADDESETQKMTSDESRETEASGADESSGTEETAVDHSAAPAEPESEEPTQPTERETEEPTQPSGQENERPSESSGTSEERTPTESSEEEKTSSETTAESAETTEEVTEKETDESTEETTEEETGETTAAVYTVTFRYNGMIFGTQKVEEGDFARKPKLAPALTGSWDFDFGTPITEDTVIEWR